MIINGYSRCNGVFFAKHLMRTDENEKVTVSDFKNLTADNVRDAFMEMKALSMGTSCKNYFMHANIDPAYGEKMTPEMWEKSIDALEKKLGLEGQPRFVVEHEKHGKTHRHIIWSRIDVEHQRTISDSMTAKRCHEVSAELNKEFGFAQVRSRYNKDGMEPPKRRAKPHEHYRAMGGEYSPERVEKECTEIFRHTDSGKAFKQALETEGYRVFQGDRRGYCVLDPEGHAHSLAKRIDGVKTAELREFMKDVPLESLPSFKEVRAEHVATLPRGKASAAIFEAFTKAQNFRDIADRLKEQGIHVACATAEDVKLNEARRAERERLGHGIEYRKFKEGQFVAVDKFGTAHAFNHRTTGLKKSDMEAKLKGVDKGMMASVEEAKARAKLDNPLSYEQKQSKERKARTFGPRGRDIGDKAGGFFKSVAGVFFGAPLNFLFGNSAPRREAPDMQAEAERSANDQPKRSAEQEAIYRLTGHFPELNDELEHDGSMRMSRPKQ